MGPVAQSAGGYRGTGRSSGARACGESKAISRRRHLVRLRAVCRGWAIEDPRSTTARRLRVALHTTPSRWPFVPARAKASGRLAARPPWILRLRQPHPHLGGGERKIQLYRDPDSARCGCGDPSRWRPRRDWCWGSKTGLTPRRLPPGAREPRDRRDRRNVAIHLFPDDVPNLAGPAPPPPEPAGFELARRDRRRCSKTCASPRKRPELHAEMLCGRGPRAPGVGSREAGLEDLTTLLGEIGIDPKAYSLNDGSGLSPNLVTPAAV